MARLREFRGIEGADFFEQDRGLEILLGDLLPDEGRAQIFSSLHECARLVSGRWNELASEAARAENLPKIIKYDRAGRRVEQVDFGPLTRQLRGEVAEFGVLTRARNNVHKFALVYLLAHNGEGSLTCGLSCTDGLIRAVEAGGPQSLRETYLPALYSARTPFAGAQFVTEQDGGSDVGAIETEARPNGDGTWSVSGEKWFCSNPDEFFLVAARPAGSPPGTAGIGVFLVPRVLPDGRVNQISFRRLKNKLGTQSLPTAEIDFRGATGHAIGDATQGFKTLMHYVINVSRMHNAANACGFLHRAFLEARNYARQRETFGRALISYPLIQETLIGMLEKLWRYRLLTFKLAALVDEHGLAPADASQAMWQRFLVNLAKYRTASTLTNSVREAILLLGGNGIVEDFTILPRLLRDSMIIETWEGPHNTLCLQIMRDAARSDLSDRWRGEVSLALEGWPEDFLSFTRGQFARAFKRAADALSRERLADRRWVETHARRLVDRMGDMLELGWMAEMAARHAGDDATIALLVSAAGRNLLRNEDEFEHPIVKPLGEHAASLIEEAAVSVDVTQL
ncbi:MAG TPA: acyl-CoA dehydrogenase family protein [Blastocatellia bacterium]|jgi:alkylation response protein AidB-like acyl-CoA dehydrogenase|nr:acyl-CoA dehydrogenase family protein [Blastocatellia bacterium]